MTPEFQKLAEGWGVFAASAWPWVCLGVVGLSMLLAGERLLRPALTVITVAALMAAGVLGATRLAGPGGASAGQIAAGAGVGLVAGVALAAGLVRLAISVAAGMSFACAGVLLAGAWLMPRDATIETARTRAASLGVVTAQDAGMLARAVLTRDRDGADARALDAAKRAGERGGAAWSTISLESRLTLLGAGATGGLCGLLLGGLMPRKAGAAVTGLAGAAMLLGAVAGLAWSRGWIVEPPDIGPAGVLTAWLGLAATGAGVQVWWQRKLAHPAPAAT